MKNRINKSKFSMYLSLVAFALYLVTNSAQAVPSFARQTGLSCQSCHTVFPELTAFGRSFKLHGYTMTNIKQVEGADNSMKLSGIPPIAAMLQVSATNTKASTPSTNISLPDQLSLFYAGAITPNIGSFIQMTLEGSGGTFGMDNTDIRYADTKGKINYGATLNNNPTVQDLWNSTQAWGYPFTTGAAVTAPVINSLGGTVVGLGGFADWGNGLYTELSLYRDTGEFDATEGLPSSTLGNAHINGLAPYVRLAWEKTFNKGDSLMLGAYGMRTTLYDLPLNQNGEPTIASANHDKYSDVAIDAQYQHQMGNGKDSFSAHATYTNENQTLDVSSPGDNPKLKSTRFDGSYVWNHKAVATLAYNNNSGFNGAYDDNAWTVQLSYLPWQNTKFTIQYVGYTKLAGDSQNASDNNTLLLQAWLMW